MGVFYSFKPNLSKRLLDQFLKDENIRFNLIQEEHRMVIELLGLNHIGCLLFYYDNPGSVEAHSSHDLLAFAIPIKLKNKFNLEVDSDNEEFVV